MMNFNFLTWIAEHPARADKSAPTDARIGLLKFSIAANSSMEGYMADNITSSAAGMQQPYMGEPRLRLKGINKSFGAVRALTDVEFEVYAGEVVGLVGDNGAGKSTLIKAISGVGPPDSGEIFLEGQPVHITGPQVSTRLGIETVYQDLALCDNLDVVANLFLGREERSPIRSLSEIHMEQRTLQVL